MTLADVSEKWTEGMSKGNEIVSAPYSDETFVPAGLLYSYLCLIKNSKLQIQKVSASALNMLTNFKVIFLSSSGSELLGS